MISTTLQWLKENILAVDVVSVTVSNDQITVITIDSAFVATIANIVDVFKPLPEPSAIPGKKYDITESRGGSTDARLWGG